MTFFSKHVSRTIYDLRLYRSITLQNSALDDIHAYAIERFFGTRRQERVCTVLAMGIAEAGLLPHAGDLKIIILFCRKRAIAEQK